MGVKFETLEVWNGAVAYGDVIEEIAADLPPSERFNLADQIRRAATSLALSLAGPVGWAEGKIFRVCPTIAGRTGGLLPSHPSVALFL